MDVPPKHRGGTSHGFPYAFEPRPWEDVLEELNRHAWPALAPVVDIVRSVIASGRSEDLAVGLSMTDPIVVPHLVPEPPFGVVFVRGPKVHPGWVEIEHRSVTGRDDRITRPRTAAVALFWRFMIEKFGVAPTG